MRIVSNGVEHAQFCSALTVPRHGDEQLFPFGHEQGSTRGRSSRDPLDPLEVVWVEFLNYVEEAFAAGRVDAPRRRIERQTVERRDGRNARDDCTGVAVENHNAWRSAYAQEQAMGLLVESNRNVLLDCRHRPGRRRPVGLAIDDHHLALFRDENEHPISAALRHAAPCMGIGCQRGDPPERGDIEYCQVTAFRIGVAASRAHVDFSARGS